MVLLKNYLAGLSAGRLVLWFYFLWYLVIVARYFDPAPAVWATSLGTAALVGVALTINASPRGGAPAALDKWQLFRFLLIPFCVSSFAALVKGRGFFLIFPPTFAENAQAGGVCLVFCAFVLFLKHVCNNSKGKCHV